MSTIKEALNKMKQAFRTKEFISALGGRRNYAYVALNRMKKRSIIRSIRRGWWAKKEASPEEIASTISFPCYLSFHSALHAHGLTTQIPQTIQLAVCRKARKYEFEGEKAREYRIKKEEFKEFEIKDGIPMAKPQKAFLDCLTLPRACPKSILAEALSKLNIWEIKKQCSKQMLKRFKEVEKDA